MKKEEKSTEHEKEIAGKNSSQMGKENDDHQLEEFLQVMQPRTKSKLWANDTLGVAPADQNDKASKKQTRTKKEVSEKLVPVHDEINDTNKREKESLNSPVAENSGDLVHDEVVSAMEYIKSKVKKNWSDSESSDDDDDDKESLKKTMENHDVHEVDPKGENDTVRQDVPEGGVNSSTSGEDAIEEALETGRLFVRNLPYAATYSSLLLLFCELGSVFCPVLKI